MTATATTAARAQSLGYARRALTAPTAVRNCPAPASCLRSPSPHCPADRRHLPARPARARVSIHAASPTTATATTAARAQSSRCARRAQTAATAVRVPDVISLSRRHRPLGHRRCPAHPALAPASTRASSRPMATATTAGLARSTRRAARVRTAPIAVSASPAAARMVRSRRRRLLRESIRRQAHRPLPVHLARARA